MMSIKLKELLTNWKYQFNDFIEKSRDKFMMQSVLDQI